MAKTPAKSKSVKPLLTIGYEQATVSAVIDELKQAKTDMVIDTRAVASSRKPGFSKKQFAAGLGLPGLAAGRVPRRHGLHAVLELGEGECERDVGSRVAVSVDVDPVDRVGVEFRAGRR